MKVLDFPQYSVEWWKARCGLPSASRAAELITPTGKPSSSADKYLAELIADSMGYKDEEVIETSWMQRGLELEEDARLHYELETDQDIEQVGLILDDKGRACCSPDGLYDDRQAGWEVKCPMPKTHIEYLIAGVLPQKYQAQVHFSMVVSGLDRWTFMSYHPEIRPLVVEVARNSYTDALEDILFDFVERLEQARKVIEWPL